MGSKEKYFQLIDKPAPAFQLLGIGGKSVSLADFTDKVVVLHFVYAGCPDVCPLHAEKHADVQAKVILSPLKDMVEKIARAHVLTPVTNAHLVCRLRLDKNTSEADTSQSQSKNRNSSGDNRTTNQL